MFVKFDLSIGDFLDRMSISEIKKYKIGGEHLNADFIRYESVYHQMIGSFQIP